MRTAVLAILILILPGFARQTVVAGDVGQQSSSTQPGYLGVAVVQVDEQIAHQLGLPSTQGAFVHGVWQGSPAAKAGLQPNDVILSVNNSPITDVSEFGQLVAGIAPHHKVQLTVIREGKKLNITAVIAARPAPRSAEAPTRIEIPAPESFFGDMPSAALRWRSSLLGVEYEGVDSQLAEFFGVKQGVLIRYVRPGSLAETAGLKAGDVVVKVNDKTAMGARGIALALQNRQPGQYELPLEVVRSHKPRLVKIKIGDVDSRSLFWPQNGAATPAE